MSVSRADFRGKRVAESESQVDNLLIANSQVRQSYWFLNVAGLLFHRSVLMSGSALSPWALVRGAANYALQVAKHLNCSWVSTAWSALH